MEQLEFEIKRNLLNNSKSRLVLNERYLKFENKYLVANTFTAFDAEEIFAFRYGINWIEYILNFGREYIIEVQNKNGKILRINFSSYFGIKLQEKHVVYAKAVNGLWDYYFEKIILNFLNEFREGKTINIGTVKIENSGITIHLDNGLYRKAKFIEWQNVETKNYRTYYSIFSKENPSQLHRGYSYKEDWNTSVLYSVVEQILNER